MNAMRSVYLSGEVRGSGNDSPVADRKAQLVGVVRFDRKWLERVPVAEGKCFGQALERCLLLNGVNS